MVVVLLGAVVAAAALLLRVFLLQYRAELAVAEWKRNDGLWWALMHENPDVEELEQWGIEQWNQGDPFH